MFACFWILIRQASLSFSSSSSSSSAHLLLIRLIDDPSSPPIISSFVSAPPASPPPSTMGVRLFRQLLLSSTWQSPSDDDRKVITLDTRPMLYGLVMSTALGLACVPRQRLGTGVDAAALILWQTKSLAPCDKRWAGALPQAKLLFCGAVHTL